MSDQEALIQAITRLRDFRKERTMMDENKVVLTLGYADLREVQVIITDCGGDYACALKIEDLIFSAAQVLEDEEDVDMVCNWAVRHGGDTECRTFGWIDEEQARRMFEVMDLPALPAVSDTKGEDNG